MSYGKRKSKKRKKKNLYTPPFLDASVSRNSIQVSCAFHSCLPLSPLVLIWKWQICVGVSLAAWDYRKLFIITPLVYQHLHTAQDIEYSSREKKRKDPPSRIGIAKGSDLPPCLIEPYRISHRIHALFFYSFLGSSLKRIYF